MTCGEGSNESDRVPNLELDELLLDVDHTSPKLYPNGKIMDWLESLIRELEQKA
jgi:hypothetical protein